MLGKFDNQGRHAAHTGYLDQQPETARLLGPDDTLEGRETKASAKARYRNLQGQESPHAFGRDHSL